MRLLVLALLVTPALAPAVGAFHDPDDTTVLHEAVIEGPFWFAYRVSVTTPGATISYEIDSPESEGRAQTAYGLWTVPVAGGKPFFVVGSGGTRVTEVATNEEPFPFETHVGPIGGGFGETSSFAVTHANVGVGEFWLVIVNTSPWATTAGVRAYGSAGVTLVATSQGTEGGLWRETDFATDEPYHHYRTGAFTLTAQAHHVRNGIREYTAEHSVFGIFTISGGERLYTHVHPDGSEVTRTFGGVITNAAAGDHTFRIDEWDVAPRAGLGPDAYVALLVADVELP